jgi:hypothetical protein
MLIEQILIGRKSSGNMWYSVSATVALGPISFRIKVIQKDTAC